MTGPEFDVVIPSTGRPSLQPLLRRLRDEGIERVIVADDRSGRGPAAARNAGWRAAGAPWIAFLDDDVLPPPGWAERLRDDLRALPDDVAASQGSVRVPLPTGRRPTDWERNVAGLQDAVWATADMAFRRDALAAVNGFDERFPRAYREDSDLGLRLLDAGWRIVRGARAVEHPVGDADRWVSLRKQAGNADDVLMTALHGRDWRGRAGAPQGRLRLHALTAGAGVLAASGALARRRRWPAIAGAAWLTLSGELAWRRIAPGPRTRDEVATMLLTSAVLPFAATAWWAVGVATLRRRLASQAPPEAVLLDRDGTLVVDVPYNGDPARVRAMPGAREALDRLRAAGVRMAVVSNQSGIARGLLTRGEVEAVNRRIEELLGPIGPWLVCPHDPDEGCACRKPAPGLVLRAAELLGVAPERCAVVGDIGADVEAARAAGARGVLVPTERTLREEVREAPEVARDLSGAVELLLRARA